MGRGGVKSFEQLAEAVGSHSTVDGLKEQSLPRAGMPRAAALRELVANPHNPRSSVRDLSDLASIAEFQLQPVVVVTRAAFQALYPDTAISVRWVVVIGNRRLAAAHKFGRADLDIVVKDELARDRATLLTAIIAENVDRSDFDVIEEAQAVESLVQELGSADLAGEQLRKSKTWVSQRRALLKLAPELQEATRRGDLAIREARALARVPYEHQVARWSAARDRLDSPDIPSEGGANPSTKEDSHPQSINARVVSRALKTFHTQPEALALALREQLGESGIKLLAAQLRKIAK
jgi:ParB family chromosome partitioning protein